MEKGNKTQLVMLLVLKGRGWGWPGVHWVAMIGIHVHEPPVMHHCLKFSGIGAPFLRGPIVGGRGVPVISGLIMRLGGGGVRTFMGIKCTPVISMGVRGFG